ncbi:MAG: efflux transporter outer membrane subunit [Luteolibacter sp.]
MKTSFPIQRLIPLSAVLVLTACKVGPNHQTPDMNLPASFSQGGVKWKRHSPEDQPKPQSWWRLYQDGTLTSLIERALQQNQNIAAASARLREARELSRAVRSEYLPSINLGASGVRSKSYASVSSSSNISNTVSLPVDLSYEFDVWGKLARRLEASEATEAAQAETLNALRLSVASEVAQTYWALRAVDADRALLSETVTLRKKALDLFGKQRDAGSISSLDYSRAETEVATAESERIALDRSRSELVNALAVLAGGVATGSQVPERTDLPKPPSVPGSVPSELLRQRPDIRAAEHRVAAANANVGVATAAFYPSFSIGASSGFSASSLGNLFKSSSLVWSIGPNVTLPITSQPYLRKQRDAAVAEHEAVTAEYRQTVLEAIRDVENALQATSILARREEAQNRATAAAGKTYNLSEKRFSAGYVSFLDVVDAERTRLDAQRAANAVKADRLAVSVALIKSIGGEW